MEQQDGKIKRNSRKEKKDGTVDWNLMKQNDGGKE